MDPVQSWLDAKEVRQMAESLMAPPPEVDKAALDAGYGDDFEGFADTAANDEQASPSQNLVPRPDGRPHAQKQFVNPSVADEGGRPVAERAGEPVPQPTPSQPQVVDESQRMTAGNSLADAKRLAEGSGMLTPSEVPDNTTQSDPSDHHSPFRVSANQQQSDSDPLARQISPATTTSSIPEPTQPAPTVEIPEVAAPLPPTPEPEIEPESVRSTFQPEIETSPLQPEPTLQSESASNEIQDDVWHDAGDDTGEARGPFLSRLQQFSAIIRRDLGAQAMFLIDNEGQILLDEVENAKLIQVARTLANASYRASRQTAGAAAVGNLHVKIGASATLEVIPVESRYGLLILGAIFPAPLGADRVRQVADVLSKAVEPHG